MKFSPVSLKQNTRKLKGGTQWAFVILGTNILLTTKTIIKTNDLLLKDLDN